jgi:hypothetical protein
MRSSRSRSCAEVVAAAAATAEAAEASGEELIPDADAAPLPMGVDPSVLDVVLIEAGLLARGDGVADEPPPNATRGGGAISTFVLPLPATPLRVLTAEETGWAIEFALAVEAEEPERKARFVASPARLEDVAPRGRFSGDTEVSLVPIF